MYLLYLDMSKAFDKVSHAKLLHRLRQFGFGGNIQDGLEENGSDLISSTDVSGQQSLEQHRNLSQ